ncbi:MAG: TIGR03643 family protein [Pseudomonadota bacterium]
MSRSGLRPYTRTRKPEPPEGTEDWIIWAAWADRVSFDEIEARTGVSEPQVIRLMRRSLKPGSFRRWRARVSGRGTKHRSRFTQGRREAGWRELIDPIE